MATIASLRIKAQWEKWLVESTHQAQPSQSPATSPGVEPRVFNEILWMAVKRQWRARLAAQQLPPAGLDRD